MANIAFDSAQQYTNDSTSNLQWGHTCNFTANPLLIVGFELQVGRTVSSITYNGVAMVLINSQASGGGTIDNVYLYRNDTSQTLVNGTSYNISIVPSNACYIYAMSASYSNVNPTTPIDVEDTNLQSDSSITGTLTTTVDNTYLIGFLGAVNNGGSAFLTAGSNTIRRTYNYYYWFAYYDSNGVRSSGSNSIAANCATSQLLAFNYAALNPTVDTTTTTTTVAPTPNNVNINTTKFLPDMSQVDFLKSIINTFNLYFTIDVVNKTINFETYDTLFMNKVDPYDITSKIMSDTLQIVKHENADMSILFENSDNLNVLGDNYYIASAGTSALDVTLKVSDPNVNKKVFNYIGTSPNTINVGFGLPAMKRMYLKNKKNYSGVGTSGNNFVIFIPNISKQTPQDNDNKVFNKRDSDTKIFNTEDTIQHNGKATLYYYYGLSTSNFEQIPAAGSDKDYFYINMDDTAQYIPFASPFLYQVYRDNINEKLVNPTDDVDSVSCSYAQSTYLTFGNDSTKVTDYSLIFNSNSDYGQTLFTKFYANRYNRYINGELLKFNMLMSNLDWKAMQINRPIRFAEQIYSLVSITNYDVVNSTAEVVLIKQL